MRWPESHLSWRCGLCSFAIDNSSYRWYRSSNELAGTLSFICSFGDPRSAFRSESSCRSGRSFICHWHYCFSCGSTYVSLQLMVQCSNCLDYRRNCLACWNWSLDPIPKWYSTERNYLHCFQSNSDLSSSSDLSAYTVLLHYHQRCFSFSCCKLHGSF